jgi:hypothetical protein
MLVVKPKANLRPRNKELREGAPQSIRRTKPFRLFNARATSTLKAKRRSAWKPCERRRDSPEPINVTRDDASEHALTFKDPAEATTRARTTKPHGAH